MTRIIDRLAIFMAIVAGLVLSGVVALTFYDVVLRYFFSAPLRGRQDIVEMGMVVTLMLAAPFAWRTGGHIGVDLYTALPWRWLEVTRALFVRLVVGGIFALIAWRAIEAIEDARLFNEATNMIMIPHTPFLMLILGASALHALILGWECVLVATGRLDDSGEPPENSPESSPE